MQIENKMQVSSEKKATILNTYNFPDYNVTIQAETLEEAEQKLLIIIKNKTK